MKRISNLKKGFTLIELSIYMGITLVIILVLTELLAAIFSTQLTTQSTAGVSQDGRHIYTRLTYDINRAENVVVPAALGEQSSSLTLTADGITYTYALSGGNLNITDPSGTNILNGPDTSISNLTFKRIGNPSGKHTFQIKYVITSRVVDKGEAESKSFQTTAGMR